MQNHRLVGEIDERFGHAKRQRPQSGAESAYKDESLHGENTVYCSIRIAAAMLNCKLNSSSDRRNKQKWMEL